MLPPTASSLASSEPSPSAVAGVGPPACTEGTYAYDPGREQMLLLNCVDQLDQASVEQIWSWDGATWVLVDDGGPPATVVAGVAFDPQDRTVIRYGGLPMTSNDCVSETWQRSEAGWEELDANAPTACDHMFMTHDTARDVSLLFGGGDDDGNLVAETWTWDGSVWARRNRRSCRQAALFAGSGRTALLYGGHDGNRVFDDWHDGSPGRSHPGPARAHFGSAVGRIGWSSARRDESITFASLRAIHGCSRTGPVESWGEVIH
jgi:hypothetical protein